MPVNAEFRRWRRRPRAWIAGVLGLAAIAFAADRLFPPDLTRLDDSSALVVDSNDRVLRAFTTRSGYWRLPADPAMVDPQYIQMLLAYEDQRYRLHPGIDPLAIVRAVGQLAKHRRVVSGASTITMQTARLLEPRPRTLGAKLVEMARAVQLEARFSKDKILAHYLTLAPYGGNLEGIRAASLAWFGKEPKHLAPSEAALLVVLPQSPETLRPDRFPERARRARNKVLTVMERRGIITPAATAEARADPVPASRHDMPFTAPHLARLLVSEVTGNVIHRTTIDGALQASLEQLLRAEAPAFDPGATAAVLVVENASRRVRTYLGSGGFFDEASAGQIDMVRAIRSPGSTLKPLIYGMGFDDLLIHPETVVIDMPTRFGGYRPENFLRKYRGETTVREALQHSLNIPAVAVLAEVGPSRFDARLRAAGIKLRYGGGGRPGLPLALGGAGISLFDLVMLYTGLANGGTLRPIELRRDVAEDGAAVPLFGAAAAWYVTRILEGATPPANFVEADRARDGQRIAFKTGTSYGYRDAWAIGYDARYTVGVWVGRPDGTPSPDRFGRATAAPLLFRVFRLLPDAGRPSNVERPDRVIEIADGGLPDRLRRFGPGSDDAVSLARSLTPPLLISFPPDGAVIDLDRFDTAAATLPLTAEGGRKPLHWIVNGRPIKSPPHRRRADWPADGAGFVNVTVIDAEGDTARSAVQLR